MERLGFLFVRLGLVRDGKHMKEMTVVDGERGAICEENITGARLVKVPDMAAGVTACDIKCY